MKEKAKEVEEKMKTTSKNFIFPRVAERLLLWKPLEYFESVTLLTDRVFLGVQDSSMGDLFTESLINLTFDFLVPRAIFDLSVFRLH